jgi:nucleotide-binding universal stress UspA family protein
MFKHVLVAIDGSECSEQALPTAIEIARKFDADLFVLHVAEHDRGRAVVYPIESPAEATRLVGDAVATARQSGLRVHGELVDKAAGHVPQAIQEAAAAHDIDLIVMGSRGLSDGLGFLVGSVTHKVMQNVAIPVLVTRGGRPATQKKPAAVGAAAGNL